MPRKSAARLHAYVTLNESPSEKEGKSATISFIVQDI